ncbi:hypothetical protein ABG768_018977 [Culter alburnus]|uniref:Uncharacterized protein n=1 Tax=Culter alburnus TaxID=194366 RepID=A0AAW2AW93_CULAL
MSVSSMPTMFSESPEQSSSSKFPNELTTALAEGCWSTSLAFSDASEKAQRKSQRSDLADETLKTSKQWRQKTMPFSARSKQGAPVVSSSEKGDLTSSPAPNSVFSDATLKTTKKRKRQRHKKSHGAPGSETTEGRKLTTSEKAESTQWRQKVPKELCWFKKSGLKWCI